MTDMIATKKQDLRRTLRDRRKRFVGALSPSVRGLAFRVLPRPVLARLPEGAVVALYQAVGDEAPTSGLAAQLAEAGYSLALPRTDAATAETDFAAWSPGDELVPSPFRTLQPDAEAASVSPGVIVAPLVGFDGALNRLGQGGGVYDRAFAAHPKAIRIGLAWSAQQVDALPVEATDMPLDMVVTEAALHERHDA